MRKSKRTLALIMATVTVLTMAVGSLAFFTDRLTGNATATAGTLDLQLTDSTGTQNQITLTGDTTEFKPGYAIKLNYNLTNAGNKSADVKETFVLTSSKTLNDAKPQFQIYAANDAAVTVNADGTVVIGDTAKALGTVTGNQVTFDVPQYILDGDDDKPGYEQDNTTYANSQAGAYVLVFMPTAGNDFQNVDLTLDYVAQAKQHRNSNQTEAAWEAVYETTVTFGSTTIDVVPAKS